MAPAKSSQPGLGGGTSLQGEQQIVFCFFTLKDHFVGKYTHLFASGNTSRITSLWSTPASSILMTTYYQQPQKLLLGRGKSVKSVTYTWQGSRCSWKNNYRFPYPCTFRMEKILILHMYYICTVLIT